GPIKARRVAALATQADICVSVDAIENVRELDEAALRLGTRPRAVIEIDTGMGRAGVAPGEPARRLAHEMAKCEGLRFAGVMTWEGHCWSIDDPDERVKEIH